MARIYDTDAGTDPDDTCVLIMAARDPSLAADLVISDDETTTLAKARFAAQILDAAGARVPVAAGLPSLRRRDADLADQAGLVEPRVVARDAVDRVIAILDAHPTVDYLGLGALTNLAAALARRPDLASRVRLAQMGPAIHGAFARERAQYNARIDPAAFRAVLCAVPRPLLVTSHVTWALHPGGRPQLGVFPDDPLGHALASSPRADLQLFARHLAAFVASGKACSLMHDPLTVLATIAPELLVTEDVDVTIDDDGWLHLGGPTPVRLARSADCDRARRMIVARLFDGDPTDLADAWRDFNTHAPVPGGKP